MRAARDACVTYTPPPGVPSTQTFGTGDNGHAAPTTVQRSDPVNTATGAYVSQVTDVALAGVGLPFAFTRTYNSNDPTGGPLGPGWSHAYGASLSCPSSGQVVFRAEDGQRLTYTTSGFFSFAAPPGARSTLGVTASGYRVTRADQVRYDFDPAGRLTRLSEGQRPLR